MSAYNVWHRSPTSAGFNQGRRSPRLHLVAMMKDENILPTPHDSLVKWAFGQPALAANYWQAMLPPEAASGIDWSTFRLEPGNHIDNGLRSTHTDLLFSACFAGTAGRVLFHLLLEHQSTVDPLMAARLHTYTSQILSSWLRNRKRGQRGSGNETGENENGDEDIVDSVIDDTGTDGVPGHNRPRRLPPILPLVLYHGDRSWNAPRQLLDLYELPAAESTFWRSHAPSLRYIVDDLTQIADESLRSRTMMALVRLVLMSLKHSIDDDPSVLIVRNVDLIREVSTSPGGDLALQVVLTYTLGVTKTVPTEGWLLQLAPALGEQFGYIKEAMMTAAQKLRQEGIERGIEQGIERGIEQGIEQGIERGQINMLRRMLCLKFGDVPESMLDRLATLAQDELDAWVQRVLNAATLDDVFSAV